MSTATTVKQQIGRVSIVRVGQIAVPIGLLVVWQLLAAATSDFALASPAATLAAISRGLEAGWLSEGLQRTLTELVIAYVLAVIAGVWAGIALGLNDFWSDVFEPIILGTYAIPKVTLYPVFLFVFQLGMDSKIAFGWFHGVFPVMIMTMSAMTTINDAHLQVGRSLRLSRWQQFREIIVPSILPGLIIGLRLGFNLTFLGIILGEMFAARAGLGYTLVEFMAGVQVAEMLAIILLLVSIATIANLGFFALENRLGARGHDTADIRM